MGLDTTHGCWHGAYSSFNRWRTKIAETAGYAVLNVKYDDGITVPTIMLDWEHISPANLAGDWDKTPEDPLIVLFAHSDCDGVIHPEHAGLLADRLEALLLDLSDENWRSKTQDFISGLRKAALAGEVIEFH